MSLRRVLGAVGAAAAVCGIVLALQPDLAALIDLDRVLVFIPAGVALLLALRGVQLRRHEERSAAEPPTVERRRSLPTPGTNVNAALSMGDVGERTPAAPGKQTLRERLEPLAVEEIVARENCTREAAAERLADGSWTDDPNAAAFFVDRLAEDRDRPIEEWFSRTVLRADPAPIERARAVITELSPDGDPGTVPPDAVSRWLEEASAPEHPEPDPTDDVTNRWTGVGALAFMAASVGIFLGRPVPVLLAVVGVAYAAAVGMGSVPSVDVRLERTVDDPEPDPGDDVTVTLAAENLGDSTLPDLRVVDGVPEMLAVSGGVPRLATALRPGERDSVTYTVEAARGRHSFGEVSLIARDWTGAVETVVERDVETELVSIPDIEAPGSFPLREQTIEYVGDVMTNTGGPGTAFYAVRDYRRGDPFSRIDWRRLARTGEPATIEFQQERAARVVLVIDTRESAYLADPENVSAVEHAVDAAGDIAAALLETGNLVGLGTLGAEWTWVAPSLGREHRREMEAALGTGEGLGSTPPPASFRARRDFNRLRRHLPDDAQVVFLSPMTDNYATFATRRLEARGHAVTLVTPDVTDPGTPGGIVAGLERDSRLRDIRGAGIPVIDWDPDEPLAVAIANSRRVWSP